MPRPVCTGSISFGLVNIPIRLVPAIDSHRVGFHEFESVLALVKKKERGETIEIGAARPKAARGVGAGDVTDE